jgi:uncharacterized protein
VIIPDANILLYAHNAASRDHSVALAWWKACLSGDEPVGIPLVVIYAFVRLSTNPRVFTAPLSPSDSIGVVREWLKQPNVQVLEARSLDCVFELLEKIGTAGNLVTDAQVAAIAIEENAAVYTSDTDFHRFPGLRLVNPLARGS